MPEKRVITENEKEQIYREMMQVMAKTGLTAIQTYELAQGFSMFVFRHMYRTVAPLQREIEQKPFGEVI